MNMPNNSKRLLLSALLLGSSLILSAINPKREYSVPVERRGKNFEELQVETGDGFKINVWHLSSDGKGTPLIISESDAGNMGDWVYLGQFLQLYGIDVWLYDYRGFGSSSDFEIKRNQLFYQEFVSDLSAVADYVHSRTQRIPCLMGISMGSLIVDEFLKNTDIPVTTVVFDGYLSDPKVWVKRLKESGKSVSLPEGYTHSRPHREGIRSLYIVSEQDKFSLKKDIPRRKSKDTVIKTFNCGHIMAFWEDTMEYVSGIADFILETH